MNAKCMQCKKRNAALDNECVRCYKREHDVAVAFEDASAHNWLFHSKPQGHGLAWCPSCRVWVKVAA